MSATSKEDRWGIVTGAAGSIGSSLCQSLRARGVRIAGLDIKQGDAVGDLVSEPVDISDYGSLERVLGELMESLGPPDLVAHVAGVYPLRAVASVSDDEVDEVLTVNFLSAVRLCRLVVPSMDARGKGRLLLMGSQAGATGGTDAVYASSKAALVALGKSLAREHGRAGVRVNIVSPGPVDSPMAAVMPAERRQHYECAIPIGRFAQPDEVAYLASFVLLDAPDALNGATIDIDGGLVRR